MQQYSIKYGNQMLYNSRVIDANIKNTFIHFDDGQNVDRRRCFSAPPKKSHSWAETQPCPRATQHCGVGCHSDTPLPEGPHTANEESEKHTHSDAPSQKKNRPNQKTRNQYHKI